MSYGKTLLEKVKEARQKTSGEGRAEKFSIVQHLVNDCLFAVKFKDIGAYGIVVEYISLNKETPMMDVELINRCLEKQANRVIDTITYLLEDFRLIELDRQNKRAQLRSYPPHKKEDLKSYYEIVIDEGTKMHFQRYQYSTSERRFEKITSQLTLETFERLINDLHGILCQEF